MHPQPLVGAENASEAQVSVEKRAPKLPKSPKVPIKLKKCLFFYVEGAGLTHDNHPSWGRLTLSLPYRIFLEGLSNPSRTPAEPQLNFRPFDFLTFRL